MANEIDYTDNITDNGKVKIENIPDNMEVTNFMVSDNRGSVRSLQVIISITEIQEEG